MSRPKPIISNSAPDNRSSSLLWRILMPRRVPLSTFTLLIAAVCLIIALAIGITLGITHGDMLRWLGTSSGVMAAGVVAGLAIAVALDKLRSSFTFTTHSVLRAVFATYLIYAVGGASGAVFALYMRAILPEGYRVLTLTQIGLAVLLTAFGFGVIGLVANHMRERAEKQKEYQAALRERIIELEASRRRIVIAQETVRRQIAGRLHGPVQTNLLILQRRLGECQGKIQSQPDEAVGLLAQIAQELDKIRNEDLRSISRELHPSIIKMGLPAGLRSLRDLFSPVLTIELEIEEEIAPPDDPASYLIAEDTGLALYRFTEEALNNITKHARATRAIIHLWRPDLEYVELSVGDDGVGFDVDTVTPGLGMLAMQDYVGAVGGDYHIESSHNKGTVVKARVPVRAQGPGPRAFG